MKKKVMNGKKAGLKILVSAMIFVELFLAGCGKSKTTNVSDNKQTIEAPADTPAPTVTPEVTIDPEIAKQEEEKRIEEAAKAYYERLTTVKSEKYIYPFTYDDVYSLTKIDQGELEYLIELPTTSGVMDKEYIKGFNGLDNSEKTTVMVELYNRLLVTLLGHTNSVIQAGLEVIFDSKEVTINNPESYKNFQQEDGTYAAGAETLKLLEDMSQNVYNSLNADWETFEKNAKAYQGLVAAIFPDGANVWNGEHLTAFSNMNNELKATLYIEAQGPLALIFARSQRDNKVITADGNDCYTTEFLIYDLCEENYTVTQEDIKKADEDDEDDEDVILNCKVGDRVNVYSFRISSKLFIDIKAEFDKKLPHPTPTATPTLALTNEQ